MNRLIILSVLISSISMYLICDPPCYVWKPLTVAKVKDAFEVPEPNNKNPFRIAKTVTLDKASRVVPVKLEYDDFVVFAWPNSTEAQRISRSIFVLAAPPNCLSWVKITESSTCRNIQETHCLVEGGGWPEKDGASKVLYIGRVKSDNKFHIGYIVECCEHLHVVKDWGSHDFISGYEVLVYKCVNTTKQPT